MQNRGLSVFLGALVILLALNVGITSKWLPIASDAANSSPLAISDFIQALNVLAVTLTLLVIAWQVQIANSLAKAQILKDRFEMYWKVTHEPTPQAAIDALRSDPARSYLDIDRFEEFYRHDDGRIRNYIEYGKIYEYLAFLFALRKMGIKDPLGPNWFPNWIADLIKNEEFLDVDKQYRDYYPEFSKYVEERVAAERAASLRK